MTISAQAAAKIRKPQRLIEDEELEASLDWLRDNASVIGRAKERAKKAEHMLKHVEAIEYRLSDAKTADGRRAQARTSARYKDAINEDAAAAGDLARLYALREAASLKIEAWRSEQANFRAMKI